VTRGVQVIEEPVDLLPSVQCLELRRGDAEKQVRLREDGAAAVHPDEDVEDLVQLLAVLQVVADQSVIVNDSVQRCQGVECTAVGRKSSLLDVLEDRGPRVRNLEDV
jgi:hypothetical protein